MRRNTGDRKKCQKFKRSRKGVGGDVKRWLPRK